MVTQMDEHTEHAKCMVPTGKQDTTNIKTHREVSLNGPENVQQINTMLHWPCTHRQILQMIHPDPRNWLPLQSHNPNPPTHHIRMQITQQTQIHSQLQKTCTMGEAHGHPQRDKQVDQIHKTLKHI